MCIRILRVLTVPGARHRVQHEFELSNVPANQCKHSIYRGNITVQKMTLVARMEPDNMELPKLL